MCHTRGLLRAAGAQRKGGTTLLETKDGFSEEVRFPLDVNCKALYTIIKLLL